MTSRMHDFTHFAYGLIRIPALYMVPERHGPSMMYLRTCPRDVDAFVRTLLYSTKGKEVNQWISYISWCVIKIAVVPPSNWFQVFMTSRTSLHLLINRLCTVSDCHGPSILSQVRRGLLLLKRCTSYTSWRIIMHYAFTYYSCTILL